MNLLLCVIFSVTPGETYSESVVIRGIGKIALPAGKWIVEDAIPVKKGEPEIFVFRKQGNRFERLSIQKYRPSIAHPIRAYFDSIGDSMSQGIPIRDANSKKKSYHDACEILRSPKARAFVSDGEPTCLTASYVYTSEDEANEPWMSHAFVCKFDGGVLVCVHASAHAISPQTVDHVYSGSNFTRELLP